MHETAPTKRGDDGNYPIAIYPISPVPKPRMTQSDRWKKRACVVRYYAFKDLVGLYNVKLPGTKSYHVVFLIGMPHSWSRKKKAKMAYTPHKQRPDKDNLEKSLLDALFTEDSQIWTGEVTKLWAPAGAIIILPKRFDVGLIQRIKQCGEEYGRSECKNLKI